MKIPSRMTIAEVARRAGVPRVTMRDRLFALDASQGGVLIRDPATGRSVVNVERLMELYAGTGLFESKTMVLHEEREDMQMQLLALRNAHRALAARVRALEAIVGNVGSVGT